MIGDRELAQSLRNDVENMSRLVNQLLEMAELETFVIGGSETADLVAVAAEIAAFLAPIALAQGQARRGHRRAQAGPGAGATPTCSAARVRNLVENALVHTPARTTVEIEVDRRERSRVSDRGPGVPAAEREQIFRRFWRRDRRRQGSSGLGLSIVARIAERHGATISGRQPPRRRRGLYLGVSRLHYRNRQYPRSRSWRQYRKQKPRPFNRVPSRPTGSAAMVGRRQTSTPGGNPKWPTPRPLAATPRSPTTR